MSLKHHATKLLDWIKNNKFASFLVLVILYLFFSTGRVSPLKYKDYDYGITSESAMLMDSFSAPTISRSTKPVRNAAPQMDVSERKVITNSSMSLQVKDVRDTMEIIKASTKELGGYMVDSNLSSPEMSESGSIAIRIPTDKLEEALERFRKLAIKVVSENISGTDITDEYIDIEERLTRLEATKARFDEIMADATEIQDILQVQREIFNIQDQIDMYKGQLDYMNKASESTLIRVYLATDELELPYTPSNAWRPALIFKQAVRSMLFTLIDIASAVIWLGVYLPLVIIAIIVVLVIKKAIKKRNP